MNNLHKQLIGTLDSTWKEISTVKMESPFYLCISMCMFLQVLQRKIHQKDNLPYKAQESFS